MFLVKDSFFNFTKFILNPIGVSTRMCAFNGDTAESPDLPHKSLVETCVIWGE